MIPILYESTETSFTSNGIGRLADCVSCLVTEERNGIFEVEFQYPVTGRLFSEITEGRIISVTHDDTKTRQPFIIYRRSAPIDGLVTFNAHHVSYNLAHCILQPFTATSVAQALSLMASESITQCDFTFWTDKTTSGNFAVKVPISIKEILGGVQGSILDVYGGGEYAWDKYTVKLYQNRGTNSGVTIRYGKNLTDMTQERDTSGMYNSVVPYWTNEETTVTLGTTVVSMDGISTVVAVPLDMSGDFQDPPTTTQLQNAAQAKLNSSGAWSPDENITVNFVALWQTDEYEDVAILQRVKLCDTVTIIYPKLNISAQAKVIKTVYNTLLDKYDEIELGKAKTSFAETITKAVESSVVKNVPTVGMMQAAIDHATELITGGLGGHVIFTLNASGEPQEILIMDTDDVQTAVNVIRINQNGIGFSTSGYNGPFTTAWTIDGAFNADFITAGKMVANMIQGGTLTLGGANNGNGVMVIKDSNGNTIGTLDKDGASLVGALIVKYSNVLQCEYSGIDELEGILTVSGVPVCFGTTYTVVNESVGYGAYLYSDTWKGMLVTTGRVTSSASDKQVICHYLYKAGTEYYTDEVFGTSPMRTTRTIRQKGSSSNAVTLFFGSNGFHFGNNSVDDSSGIYPNSSGWGDDLVIGLYSNKFIAKCTSAIYLYLTSSGLKVNGSDVQLNSNSSRRYKHDIEILTDDELDPHRLYKLEVKQFIYNDDTILQYKDMAGQVLPGFIAEEVAEVYPSAVIHDSGTGQIESWDERRLIPGMLALIQEQKKHIDELTARLEALEAKL